MLQQLSELVRKRKFFWWNIKNIEVKLIAVIFYYVGISFRKTSKILADFERFSYESCKDTVS